MKKKVTTTGLEPAKSDLRVSDSTNCYRYVRLNMQLYLIDRLFPYPELFDSDFNSIFDSASLSYVRDTFLTMINH